MLSKTTARTLAIALVLVFVFLAISFSTVWSRPSYTVYPTPSIVPTLIQQERDNWCGPSSLQSAIDWVWRYNYNTSKLIPQATLWAYMRDNTCYNAGTGRDAALPGTVGDGDQDIRKMNIAKDFGVDPHAMAWTMWIKTPYGFNYHYRSYGNITNATRWLLYTVEKYHEPVFAAVWDGTHWVLVIGYDSDSPAYPGSPGTITRIRIANPFDGQQYWVIYPVPWTTYWFTAYTNDNDPDPTTGWYITPPPHWQYHWVTVERDESTLSADWGMSFITTLQPINPQPLTYLPNIQALYGLNSTIAIHNDDSTIANVTITFYDATGRPVATMPSTPVGVNATLVLDVANFLSSNYGIYEFYGSAVVAATQKVSAVVTNRDVSPVMARAHTGIAPNGSSSIIRAGYNHYLPILYRHATWGYYSTIAIQNTTGTTANVTVTFRWPDGSQQYTNTYTIPAYSVKKIYLEYDFDWNNYFGTATISSNQPVAVVVESVNWNKAVYMDYNTLTAGLNEVYLPYLMKNYGGWGSCFTVQNTTNNLATVTPYYFPASGGVFTGAIINLAGRGSQTVCQPNVIGLPNGSSSARLYATQPVVVVVNQDNANWGGAGNQVMSYTGLGGAGNATQTVVLPYMLSGYSNNGETWNSGIAVQNVGSVTTNITANFYNSDGIFVTSYTWPNVGQYRIALIYLPSVPGMTSNFIGSAKVTASTSILALGNASCIAGCIGDTSQTYNGVNR
jgi:hypothetical protein